MAVAAFDDNLHCWECHGNIESDQEFTFISKIGVYDDDKNLIAIAKVATPVRKLETDEYTFFLVHAILNYIWPGL